MQNCCLGRNPSPESFAKWCKKRGIFLHPDVAFLVPTKTMGCGVFATKPLPTGTVVIECPAASSVSPYVDPAVDSPSIAVLRRPEHEKEFKADPALYAVLRLLAELCQTAGAVQGSGTGTLSPWRPWLEACPRMPEHLYYVRSPADLQALGLPIGKEAGKEATAVDKASVAAVNPLSWTTVSQQLRDMRALERWAAVERFAALYPKTWPPAVATFELFCECMAQVSSRNFHREEVPSREGPYLLPGLDIINHSFDANCGFEMRGGGRKHATSFTVVATRPLQRGEQVYCSYGRIGVARFAVEFQFATAAVVKEDIVRFAAPTLASLAASLHASGLCRRHTGAETPTPMFGGSTSTTTTSTGDALSADVVAAMAAAAVRIAAEDTIAAPPALLAEMEFRIDRLQRMGLLFDEGLYLLQPTGYPVEVSNNSSGTDARPAASAPDRGTLVRLNEARAGEVESNLHVLLVVAYLLLFVGEAREGFEAVYQRMSKEWVPPCVQARGSGGSGGGMRSPAPPALARDLAFLKRLTVLLLAAKRAAAHRQDGLVDGHFGPASLTPAAAVDGSALDTAPVPPAKGPKPTAKMDTEPFAARVAEARCRLLHTTLRSEAAVLSAYTELVVKL